MLIESETYNLQIPSSAENINQLPLILDYIKLNTDVNNEVLSNMEIVIGEALVNAIIHGNLGNASKFINVSITTDDDRVKLLIKDQGRGFNHNQIPDPTLPENIERPSGRGIFIMKQLCDLVVFSDGGTLVELHFKL